MDSVLLSRLRAGPWMGSENSERGTILFSSTRVAGASVCTGGAASGRETIYQEKFGVERVGPEGLGQKRCQAVVTVARQGGGVGGLILRMCKIKREA